MSAPKRIQRRRTKGWRMPEGAVYVGRGTKWGNPYKLGQHVLIAGKPETEDGVTTKQFLHVTPWQAVQLYRLWITATSSHDVPFGHVFSSDVRVLAGKDLVCWCPLTDEHGNHVPCHADVLLELANGGLS